MTEKAPYTVASIRVLGRFSGGLIGENAWKSMRFRVKKRSSVDKLKQNDDASVGKSILLSVVSDQNEYFSTYLCFCGSN